jgi:hypothetical protein
MIRRQIKDPGLRLLSTSLDFLTPLELCLIR